MTEHDRITLHERTVRLEERERVCALLEESARWCDAQAEAEMVAHGRTLLYSIHAAEADALNLTASRIKREEHWVTKEGA